MHKLLLLVVMLLSTPTPAPALSSTVTQTQEKPAPKPIQPDCPKFDYPKGTPFGASVAEIEEKLRMTECTWEKPGDVDSEVFTRFSVPAHLYQKDLGWWMGYAHLPASMVEARKVKCKCWTSIEEMLLYFHRAEDESTRLMAVGKFYFSVDPVEVKRSIDRKAGLLGVGYDDVYRSLGSRDERSATTVVWRGKKQDAFLCAVQSPWTTYLYSLNIEKTEWGQYAKHLKAVRQKAAAKEAEGAQKAGSEF